MISAADSAANVVFPYVSLDTYKALKRALAGHELRPSYVRGQLRFPGRIEGVSWSAYKNFLHAWGDHHVRHIYDQGLLVIMSPLKSHDWIKRLIGRFIEAMTFDQEIPIQSIGSTTITSDASEQGFEADESYYIANERAVRGKIEFEPDVDPPPDLIVEVDVTSSSESQLPLYAKLKVPEVWRHDGRKLEFLVRTTRGGYKRSRSSKAFPFLGPDDISRFLEQYGTMSENDLVKQFIRWARSRRKAYETKKN